MRDLDRDLAHVHFFDALPRLCGADVCDGTIPGTGVRAFADKDHYTDAAALYLGSFLACFLDDRLGPAEVPSERVPRKPTLG